MTPVILQQFRMYYQNAPEAQGGQRPIGVVLWARVSEEVEQMLEKELGTATSKKELGTRKN